mgnify:CR=1 FL=1
MRGIQKNLIINSPYAALPTQRRPVHASSTGSSAFISYPNNQLTPVKIVYVLFLIFRGQIMKMDLLDIYSDYLISQNHHATGTGLASMLDGEASHDQISRSKTVESGRMS